MRKFKSIIYGLLLGAAVASPAMAEFYAISGGKAVFTTSTPYRCAGAPDTAPMGCMFVALFTYDGNGRAVVVTSKGSDFSSTHYAGTLREGSGTIRLTFADALNGTVRLNDDQPVSMTRHTIKAGRPGPVFNAIGSNVYAELGQAEPEIAVEVQGDEVFGVRFVSGSWRVYTGPMVLDTQHATSSYAGNEYTATAGPVLSITGSVNQWYTRNNEIRIGDRRLYPLAY